MERYLVFFTTFSESGWGGVTYRDAAAIVTDRNNEMPFGWRPDDIGGLPVGEVKYLVPLGAETDVSLFSAEYDKHVDLTVDGDAVVINDPNIGIKTKGIAIDTDVDGEDEDELAAIRQEADRSFEKRIGSE